MMLLIAVSFFVRAAQPESPVWTRTLLYSACCLNVSEDNKKISSKAGFLENGSSSFLSQNQNMR